MVDVPVPLPSLACMPTSLHSLPTLRRLLVQARLFPSLYITIVTTFRRIYALTRIYIGGLCGLSIHEVVQFVFVFRRAGLCCSVTDCAKISEFTDCLSMLPAAVLWSLQSHFLMWLRERDGVVVILVGTLRQVPTSSRTENWWRCLSLRSSTACEVVTLCWYAEIGVYCATCACLHARCWVTIGADAPDSAEHRPEVSLLYEFQFSRHRFPIKSAPCE